MVTFTEGRWVPMSMVLSLCIIAGERCPLAMAGLSCVITVAGRWIPIPAIIVGSTLVGGVIVFTNAGMPRFSGLRSRCPSRPSR